MWWSVNVCVMIVRVVNSVLKSSTSNNGMCFVIMPSVAE